MRTIAVTGSTGMIGKEVVKVLKKKGYEVKEFTIEGRRGNVENIEEVEAFLEKVDGVIHLAAKIDLATTWLEFYKINVIGSKNIAEISAKRKIRTVMVSTIMVFGETGGKIGNEQWDKRTQSENKYVLSKILALKEVEMVNLKVVTVYPTIVVDKEKIRDKKAVYSGFSRWIWKNIGGGIPGGIMAAIGPKNRRMNMVEVGDVAVGIVLAWEIGVEGDDYILGGENIEVGVYLKLISQKLDINRMNFRIPEWPFRLVKNMAKYFNLPSILVNLSLSIGGDMYFSSKKARQILGYRPTWKLM
jgi:nucleoside-diphosphate-sugar epimerase